jgi:hypothetical protein
MDQNNRQAADLKALVESVLQQEGVIGLAVLSGAVAAGVTPPASPVSDENSSVANVVFTAYFQRNKSASSLIRRILMQVVLSQWQLELRS